MLLLLLLLLRLLLLLLLLMLLLLVLFFVFAVLHAVDADDERWQTLSQNKKLKLKLMSLLSRAPSVPPGRCKLMSLPCRPADSWFWLWRCCPDVWLTLRLHCSDVVAQFVIVVSLSLRSATMSNSRCLCCDGTYRLLFVFWHSRDTKISDFSSRPWRNLPPTWVIHRRPADQPTTRRSTLTWGLIKEKPHKKFMWICALWAGLQVAMWVNHVGPRVADFNMAFWKNLLILVHFDLKRPILVHLGLPTVLWPLNPESSRDEKTYTTTTTERKLFLQLYWPQTKLSKPVVDTETLWKPAKNHIYHRYFSSVGPHFFRHNSSQEQGGVWFLFLGERQNGTLKGGRPKFWDIRCECRTLSWLPQNCRKLSWHLMTLLWRTLSHEQRDRQTVVTCRTIVYDFFPSPSRRPLLTFADFPRSKLAATTNRCRRLSSAS